VKLTILMPCLNEAETVAVCVSKARTWLDEHDLSGEVLVADNGSDDGSQELARLAGARVVNVRRRGYGAALMAGIEDANGEFIVMGDADDSYDFSSLDPFVDALEQGADLVMGNRFQGGIEKGAMPALHRYLGNPVLSGIGRLFFGGGVGDFHCGLRGFRRSSILSLHLQSPGMEFASEMVVKATLHGLVIAEVPTTLQPDGRTRPPHLRAGRDGWRHLRFLLLYCPRWLFFYPGLALFVVGMSVGARLTVGNWRLGPVVLSVDTLVVCAAIVLIGYQSIWFAVLSKAFASREGLLPFDVRVDRFRRRFRLERALLASAVAALAGLVGFVVALLRWRDTNYGPLHAASTIRLVVPSMTVLVLASQTALASLLLSILALPSSRPAAALANPVRETRVEAKSQMV
jgi:glycosyltransferase involved in cell wall biosynthesis